jgi:hypothetical protein
MNGILAPLVEDQITPIYSTVTVTTILFFIVLCEATESNQKRLVAKVCRRSL